MWILNNKIMLQQHKNEKIIMFNFIDFTLIFYSARVFIASFLFGCIIARSGLEVLVSLNFSGFKTVRHWIDLELSLTQIFFGGRHGWPNLKVFQFNINVFIDLFWWVWNWIFWFCSKQRGWYWTGIFHRKLRISGKFRESLGP
jgi:hypothetical protein